MVRFAHISDVHLGGWKQQPMQDLNFQSFRLAIDICIKENVEFILIAGDLFDSAYPPIEILKETFAEFTRIKESKIPVYIIAGSHDFSVSGKTFLDVLEKAGFCKNLHMEEDRGDGFITLNSTVYGNTAMYGYPGKKSGLEIEDLKKIKLNDAPGLFKILALHTTIDKAKGTLPIDSVAVSCLPKVDYYALVHLHIDFRYENFIYPGPIFPNNFQELEDLKYGSFYIFDNSFPSPLKKIELKLKDVVSFDFQFKNATIATSQIISELDRTPIKDKIVLLRVSGELEVGKQSDIKFSDIEDFAMKKGAYFVLKNTHDLSVKELQLKVEIKADESVEEETIKDYSKDNPSDFNALIPELMNSLSLEKQEDEKTEVFNNRILDGIKKILKF
jgi:hypothetical protein